MNLDLLLASSYAFTMCPLQTDNKIEISTSDIKVINAVGVAQYSDEAKNTMFKQLEQVKAMYDILGYNNPLVIDIANDILTSCRNQNKFDVTISRTGDNEILIYRKENGEYKNIMIDESGDIEFLYIPVDRRNTYNEHYSF